MKKNFLLIGCIFSQFQISNLDTMKNKKKKFTIIDELTTWQSRLIMQWTIKA